MVDIFYKSAKVALATEIEDIYQFHNKPIIIGKQALYSLDCLLDNKFEQIPLVVTDGSEDKEYLNQLSKGELFVWNLVDANRNSCSRNSNDSAFEGSQSMENDTLITGTPRKVARDITYYEIESDIEDKITYVFHIT